MADVDLSGVSTQLYISVCYETVDGLVSLTNACLNFITFYVLVKQSVNFTPKSESGVVAVSKTNDYGLVQ